MNNKSKKDNAKMSYKRPVALVLVCAMLLAVSIFTGCTKYEYAIELKDGGKTVGGIDQKLMSLIMSVSNSQMGVDAYAGTNIWNTPYPGSDKTIKDIVVAQTKAYAKGLLQAEYLCDKVYGIGLTDEQTALVDTCIEDMKNLYGGKKGLESILSTYGTDIGSLSRYMLLVIKQKIVYEALYSVDTGIRYSEIQKNKESYFENNFLVEDHILLKYSGGIKADGTEIPLTQEEKLKKLETAKTLYAEIENGVRTFDDALKEFGEDTYILGYPFGYFVMKDADMGSLSHDVQNAVREMEVGEIKFVETNEGAYIVRRNPMSPELYKSNGNFELQLESMVVQEDFLTLCENAATVNVNDEIINGLDPENIPSFNMSLLGQE